MHKLNFFTNVKQRHVYHPPLSSTKRTCFIFNFTIWTSWATILWTCFLPNCELPGHLPRITVLYGWNQWLRTESNCDQTVGISDYKHLKLLAVFAIPFRVVTVCGPTDDQFFLGGGTRQTLDLALQMYLDSLCVLLIVASF